MAEEDRDDEDWDDFEDDLYAHPDEYNDEYFDGTGSTKNQTGKLITVLGYFALAIVAAQALWWLYKMYQEKKSQKTGLGYSNQYVPSLPQIQDGIVENELQLPAYKVYD